MGRYYQPISVPRTRLIHRAQDLFILHTVPGDKDVDPAVNLNSKMDFELQSPSGQWDNLVMTVIPDPPVYFCFQCKCLTSSCDPKW